MKKSCPAPQCIDTFRSLLSSSPSLQDSHSIFKWVLLLEPFSTIPLAVVSEQSMPVMPIHLMDV